MQNTASLAITVRATIGTFDWTLTPRPARLSWRRFANDYNGYIRWAFNKVQCLSRSLSDYDGRLVSIRNGSKIVDVPYKVYTWFDPATRKQTQVDIFQDFS